MGRFLVGSDGHESLRKLPSGVIPDKSKSVPGSNALDCARGNGGLRETAIDIITKRGKNRSVGRAGEPNIRVIELLRTPRQW